MRATRRARRDRRGYVLLTSLMMVSIFLVLGMAMLGLASTSRRTAIRRLLSAQALNLAMGAADHTVAELKSTGSGTPFSNRAIGAGTATVTVTSVAGTTRRIILAAGTATGGGFSVSRSVRCTVDTGSIAPVFYKALAARRDFDIHGNVAVNSAPVLHQGDVHSNGALSLGGSAVLVDGRATASGALTTAGSPTVTGGKTSGVPAMTFPTIDTAFENQSLANGSSVGSKTVSNGSLVKGKITGDLSVAAPSGCTVTGVVWVTGNVSISGPILGTGTIVCDGTISLDAKFDYPAGVTPNIALLTTSSAAVAADLGGNRQFNGLVYAPNGGVRVRGTATFSGSIIADTIDLGGTPVVTRWTSFDQNPPSLPSIFQVKGWEEL